MCNYPSKNLMLEICHGVLRDNKSLSTVPMDTDT